jgi:hypothetical protein
MTVRMISTVRRVPTKPSSVRRGFVPVAFEGPGASEDDDDGGAGGASVDKTFLRAIRRRRARTGDNRVRSSSPNQALSRVDTVSMPYGDVTHRAAQWNQIS